MPSDQVVEIFAQGQVPAEMMGPDGPRYGKCEVVPPVATLAFLDSASPQADKMFKVLLRDQRMVVVRGHSLTFIPNATNPNDAGSYGIVARLDGREELVAVFRASEVTGVFDGTLQTG
jgi:hypothetical protein